MRRLQANIWNAVDLRFSIRELIAWAAIVALALALHFSNTENAKLKAKLNVAFPRPHIWMQDVSPLEERYTTTANIALTGKLYPNFDNAAKRHSVSAKLLDPLTGRMLCQVTDSLSSNGSFAFTLNHGQNLSPGFYPVLVEIFDESERLAHGTSTVQLVK